MKQSKQAPLAHEINEVVLLTYLLFCFLITTHFLQRVFSCFVRCHCIIPVCSVSAPVPTLCLPPPATQTVASAAFLGEDIINNNSNNKNSSSSFAFLFFYFILFAHLGCPQDQLRSAGHECSGSHAEPRALKTRAPLEAVEEAIRRAAAAKKACMHAIHTIR